MLAFNNAIYNFTYILTLSKGDKTTDYLANYPCSMELFQIETIVKQIEKQIESQSSFSKDSGGPKNKEQNF